MKLFDFQTNEEACLNHPDMVCKHCPRQLEEISCVPVGSKLCREVIRQLLLTLSSKAAVSCMWSANATSSQSFWQETVCQLSISAAEWLQLGVGCGGWWLQNKTPKGYFGVQSWWCNECQVSWAQCTHCVSLVCACLLHTPFPHCPGVYKAQVNEQGFFFVVELNTSGVPTWVLNHLASLLLGEQTIIPTHASVCAALLTTLLGHLFLLLWLMSK